MNNNIKNSISHYGPDIFLFITPEILDHIINTTPAPDDGQWARLLCDSKTTTSKAILGRINRLRRESISQAIEHAQPASMQEIGELFCSAGVSEKDISKSPADHPQTRDPEISDAARSMVLSTSRFRG